MKPREFNPRATLISALVIIGLFAYTYTRKVVSYPHAQFSGKTMGTYFRIRVSDANYSSPDYRRLDRAINDELQNINQQMSTWIADSEISIFNQSTSITPFAVSKEFATVVQSALKWSAATEGAFDPTIKPLVELWGFGENNFPGKTPTAEEIAAVQTRIGYHHLTAPGETTIQKDIPDLRVDLNAIAKGYAVDRLYTLLQERNLTNALVEIGGEIRTSGVHTNGLPFRTGIAVPTDHREYDGVPYGKKIIALNGAAMATSGDYQNFIQNDDGQRLAHIIDPNAGRPRQTDLASVSVIAPTCMQADTIATALYVMGKDKGLPWVEAQPDIEALFIFRAEKDFVDVESSGFSRYLYRPKSASP